MSNLITARDGTIYDLVANGAEGKVQVYAVDIETGIIEASCDYYDGFFVGCVGDNVVDLPAEVVAAADPIKGAEYIVRNYL